MAKSTTKTATKAKTTATKAKAPDLAKLKSLADQIASYPSGPDTELLELLKRDEGLKLTFTPSAGGIYKARMAGVTAQSSGGNIMALNNWANKARRLIKDAA